MGYDEKLADRIRVVLPLREDLSERKMFGGLAFLMDGKMFCGVIKDDLVVRVGPDRYEAALSEPHVRPMDFTGRPMKGYVFVGSPGHQDSASIGRWIDWAREFVATLPAKKASRSRRAKA